MEMRERMSGNICRCGAYPNIAEAMTEVAGAQHETFYLKSLWGSMRFEDARCNRRHLGHLRCGQQSVHRRTLAQLHVHALNRISVREIQGQLLEFCGLQVSSDLISTVTDEVLADAEQWQQRPNK
ncbi:hypothetical protein GCM10010985_31240 [Caballeronia grimmiae]|uniref:Uncharacterized protein n=1 Tax=Caballeronia grimmiae TaxID=1071679 RepID=A0ABQ1RM62_9BURK|nr:hypothetical protein GCM10010985_31240 [Caballeronia grimmiae]